MAETTAALLGGFLHALVDIFKRRGAPTAPAPAPDPAPSLPALAEKIAKTIWAKPIGGRT